MKIQTLGTALALFTLCGAAFAVAADSPPGAAAPGGGAIAEACRQDVQTLCPGIEPGGGRIMACLKKNQAKVSEGCKAAAKAQRAERKHPAS
jgi:hypothetical protein